MKLRLEVRDNTTILSVTEGMTQEDLQILNAGVNKLVQSGKRLLLLDLTALAIEDYDPTSIRDELVNMQTWVQMAAAQILIVSPIDGFGDAPTRERGLELLGSTMGKLLAMESRLKMQLRTLKQDRTDAANQLQAVSSRGDAGNILELRQENGQLKAEIAALEKQIRQRLAQRIEPYDASAHAAKRDNLYRIFVSVLEREGILPVS